MIFTNTYLRLQKDMSEENDTVTKQSLPVESKEEEMKN